MNNTPSSSTQPTSPVLLQRFRQVFRKELFLVTIILIVALAFFFRDIVFSNRTFLMEGSILGTMPFPDIGPYQYEGSRNISVWDPGALALAIEPWDRYIAQTYQSGQIPFWDPYQGLGIPLQSNGGTGTFDPIKAIIYLTPIQGWPSAVDIQVLVRLFLAGFFTYLFMRALKVGMFGALFAAITYMLATFLVHNTNMSFFRLDTLLPLLMYAYHHLATRRTFGASIVVIASVYLLVVGDFPEVLPLHIGLGLIWYFFQSGLQVRQAKQKVGIVSILMLAGSTTMAGGLLGSFTVLPFLQLFQSGYHVHTPGVPLIPINYPLYEAGGFFTASTLNVGRLTLFSVALCIFLIFVGFRPHVTDEKLRKLRQLGLVLLAIAVIMILVIYRVPGFGWIANLPILNIIYLNRSIQPDIVFCVATASGIGLELLLSSKIKFRVRWSIISTSVAFALSVLATVVIHNAPTPFLDHTNILFIGVNRAVKPFPGEANYLFIGGVLLILFNLFVRMEGRGKTGVTFAGILIVAFAVLDPAFYQLANRPTRYEPYTPPPFVTYLQGLPQPFRIIGLDAIMVPAMASAYRLEDIRFLDAVYPKKLYDFEQRYLAPVDHPVWETLTRFDGFSSPPVFGHLMDMVNVGYVLSTEPTPPASDYGDANQFEQVYNAEGIYIYKNKNAYPRAYIVHKAEIIPQESDILNRLAAADYDPSRSVILDEALPTTFTQSLPTDAGTYEKAEVTAKDINTTVISANLMQPGILVLSELAYPGWQATVDGQPAKIYNAYGFMRAVTLTAGTHLIVFSYHPTLFLVGLAIALTTLIAIILVGVIIYIRRKRGVSTGMVTN